MGNIVTFLKNIITAEKGKDVRQSMHDAIKQVYDDAAQSGNANMEVTLARGTEPTLNDRLVKMDEVAETTNEQLAQREQEISDLDTVKMDKDTLDIAVSQINKNKGLLDETYFTDDVKRQWTGNTPINATPPFRGVTNDKLADKSIDFMRNTNHVPLVFKKKPKNLFNKNEVLQGYFVSGSSGQLIENANYTVLQFIPINSGMNYSLGVPEQCAWYDENYNFISGFGSTQTLPVTAPPNAKYISISTHISKVGAQMLVQGDDAGVYEPYFTDLKVKAQDYFTFDNHSIPISKLVEVEPTANMFNKNDPEIVFGKYVDYNSGVLKENATYFTAKIYVEPIITYAATNNQFTPLAYFDIVGNFIIGDGRRTGDTVRIPFTTPANTSYILISGLLSELDTFQVVKGDVLPEYVDYGYSLKGLVLPNNKKEYKPFYTLNDAWVAWNVGEKFPMAYYGDSTSDGANTTGHVPNTLGTDNTSPNAYSMKLQEKLREATNNNILRIYNAGFNGQNAQWGANNVSNEFGEGTAYSDVKMVGISFGINDRGSSLAPDEKAYRANFKKNVISIIEQLYEMNIQPFLLTTQATSEVGTDGSAPLKSSMNIETIANEVKRELAREYNLELIDMNEFTERFMKYSKYPLTTIISDTLHFGDVGHKYEADTLFYHINPQTILIDEPYQLDFYTQKMIGNIDYHLITLTSSPADSFKAFADYVKADNTDLNIVNYWIFIDGQTQRKLTAYKSRNESLTYVKVDGVKTVLSGLEIELGELELGLHKLEVYTGESTMVDFKGFKIS